MIEFVVEASIFLEPEEVFPDGVPEGYDAEDVAEVAAKSRNVTRWLKDWNLERDLDVVVYVNGEKASVPFK